jgi:hypothetical protein
MPHRAGDSVPKRDGLIEMGRGWRHREYPICAGGAGYARATRTNGEKALILRALCARKMSAVSEKHTEKYTNGMLP